MVDIQVARQAYKRFEISAVALIHEVDIPPDGLSRIRGNKKLEYLMCTAVDKTPILQWIYREGLQSTTSW